MLCACLGSQIFLLWEFRFQLKNEGVDAKCKKFKEPVRWVRSWINVCMSAMKHVYDGNPKRGVWMLQLFLSHLAAILACFMQLGLSKSTLLWELKIPAEKRMLMQSVCLPLGIYILYGRSHCQEDYEHAHLIPLFTLLLRHILYNSLLESLHLPLEISSRSPRQRIHSWVFRKLVGMLWKLTSSMHIIVVDGPLVICDFYCIPIKCYVIENVTICLILWFISTFTCRCCLNMDTFQKKLYQLGRFLIPLMISCINAMHSNISSKGLCSISKQTPKNP